MYAYALAICLCQLDECAHGGPGSKNVPARLQGVV